MNYNVRLTHNRTILVDQEKAEELMKLKQEGSNDLVKIGGGLHYLRDVRSVEPEHPLFKTPPEDMKEAKLDEWFHKKLAELAEQSTEEKIERELEKRIFIGYQLSHQRFTKSSEGKLDFKVKIDEWEKVKKEVRPLLKDFFTQYPYYPWCPMQIWQPFIEFGSSFHQYFRFVIRLDQQVKRWVLMEGEQLAALAE